MTEKIFYREPERVTLLSEVIEIRTGKKGTGLAFLETIFSPQGGGQPADRGIITGDDWVLKVNEVEEEEGTIWHWGTLAGEIPSRGSKATMHLDSRWRKEVCEQHTAQHLFSAVLEKEYGLPTTGFAILPAWTKIEVPSTPPLTSSLLQEAEEKTRHYIAQRIPLHIFWETEEKRIVEIPGLDTNPCGGLHLPDTGYIGSFAVLRSYRKNRDFWRIEFVAGQRVTSYLQRAVQQLDRLQSLLGTQDPVTGVENFFVKMKNAEREIKRLAEELTQAKASLLIQEAQDTPWGKVVIWYASCEIHELRLLAKALAKDHVSSLLGNEKNQVVFASSSPAWGEKILTLLQTHGFKGTVHPSFGEGQVKDVPSFFLLVKKEL